MFYKCVHVDVLIINFYKARIKGEQIQYSVDVEQAQTHKNSNAESLCVNILRLICQVIKSRKILMKKHPTRSWEESASVEKP